jgi:cyclophilin family peptidyl-prolyl cis-trans isomerase
MGPIHPFECGLSETGAPPMPNARDRGPTCRKEPRYNAFVLFLSLAVTLFLQVPPLVGVAMQTAAPQEPAPLEPAPGNGVVVISTSLGDVTVELFNDKAPVSVANFLSYATEGFYSGTVFHRVVSGFVVQGGGYTATMAEKPTRPPIQNEATNGLRNVRGTVAMARTQSLRSATSQFYFNVSNNQDLDHQGFSPRDFGYAVFGRVLSGMDVVDRISRVLTHSSAGMDDVPVEPVTITGVKVVR